MSEKNVYLICFLIKKILECLTASYNCTSFQADFKAGLDKAKERYNKLCQEEVELTKKTSNQEIQIARVKTANKNLHNCETENNSEFKQKYSQLFAKLKKITNENTKMQCSIDEKQQQWDNLKRVQGDILKKQQRHNELQLKLLSLKKENAETNEQISNARKNICELKFRQEPEANSPLLDPKRLRILSATTVVSIAEKIGFPILILFLYFVNQDEHVEIESNSSCVNLIDFELSVSIEFVLNTISNPQSFVGIFPTFSYKTHLKYSTLPTTPNIKIEIIARQMDI